MFFGFEFIINKTTHDLINLFENIDFSSYCFVEESSEIYDVNNPHKCLYDDFGNDEIPKIVDLNIPHFILDINAKIIKGKKCCVYLYCYDSYYGIILINDEYLEKNIRINLQKKFEFRQLSLKRVNGYLNFLDGFK